ncbi:MAG: IS256 family transposase, partial [Nitrospinota bacterium]|nr:IS256 family transposase [Nitrospinota bacterium]
MFKIIESTADGKCEEPGRMLDEIAREGARRMLAVAMEAEAASYVEDHQHERDEDARALVVRNGKARPRKITLGAGTV